MSDTLSSDKIDSKDKTNRWHGIDITLEKAIETVKDVISTPFSTREKDNPNNNSKSISTNKRKYATCTQKKKELQEVDSSGIKIKNTYHKLIKVDKQGTTNLENTINHRNELENNIMHIIGGNMGMRFIWEKIIGSAMNEDNISFLYYSMLFSRKAKNLTYYFDELNATIRTARQRFSRDQNSQMAAFVCSDYQYEIECLSLLSKYEYLHSSTVDEDKMNSTFFYNWLNNIPDENLAKSVINYKGGCDV